MENLGGVAASTAANSNAQQTTWGGRSYGVYAEYAYMDIPRQIFLAGQTGECITVTRDYTLRSSLLGIADHIMSLLTDARLSGLFQGSLVVMGKASGRDVFVSLSEHNSRGAYHNSSDDGDDESIDQIDKQSALMPIKIARFDVCATGHREALEFLFNGIAARFKSEVYPTIHWWRRGENGRAETKAVYLSPQKHRLHAEYYPDMGDPYRFIAGYLASTAAILLMAGPPGTGKTTLLRHMICEHNLSAHVIYDEALMDSDSVFQSFMFNANADILIIEDADTLLSSREQAQNKVMSRLLNVSDGLIKLPEKKIVFTTNLSDFGKIDPAIIRPGRCYAAVQTRALDLAEAAAAAKVADLPIPTEKRQYTLAELFNHNTRLPSVRRIGIA